MATGPQKYPGASTAHWWQTSWGGDLMEVNVAVLHTTEGIGLPDYNGGSMAPNLTAVADIAGQRLRWYQHFDIDRSSRALQNLAGGVQTNTLNVTQVELDGTCDYSKREHWGSRVAGKDYIYWGNPPDWALQDLADFLSWLNKSHGVPLTGPAMWLTYGPDSRRSGVAPASYGASPARMTFAAWNAFKGICGHQHVPENDHGDPGSLPFAKLIGLAKGSAPTPASVPKAASKPKYEPYPGEAFFMKSGKPALGTSSPVFTAMGKRLVAVGCGRYKVGPGPTLGQADVDSYEAWQRRCGYSGAAAKWPPGKTTWNKLQVPNV